MPLEIFNKGTGFIGEVGDNWTISQNGSPAIVGQGSGRLGGITFSARCDRTSKFTIDNYLSVRHYFDDGTARWLSTFDVYVRSVTTNGEFGAFVGVSPLSALDVSRTSSVDTAGVYQRAIRLPSQMPYTIGATTYYTGGSYQTVDGQQVWVPKPIVIYDMAASDAFTYVLASGGHNGEVVFLMGTDGLFSSVWPVYSDATDVADPQARYMSYANSSLFIAQVAADRVKRFTFDGSFMLQFGSAGTGDGQFTTISGIAANDTGIDAVYVTDRAQGRVQWFSKTGTFGGKFGTPGTGSGNFTFQTPTGVAVDPLTNRVLVADHRGRVREYSSGGGTYYTVVMGSYDFNTNQALGDFVANADIALSFDSLGNAYGYQQGRIYKYVRNNGGWITSPVESVKRWTTPAADEPTQPTVFTISRYTGIIHTARTQDMIDQYSGSMGNLRAYFLYYIALAAPDFPVRFQAINSPWAFGELAFPAWTGNVWDRLCELAAATSNALMMFDGRLVIVNREARWFDLPQDIEIEPLQLDSRGAGRSVEVINYRSRWTAGQEVMYDAQADDQRRINVNVGDFTYVTVNQNSHPEYLVNPTAATTRGDGQYVVVDREDLVVTPTLWRNYGGAILANLGDRPGDIDLTIVGPRLPIPGYEGPFTIGDQFGSSALSVMGAGVKIDPETIRVGTGLSESVTANEVAQSIDSPFIWNATTAYSEGAWAAYCSGTPNQRVKMTLPLDRALPWVGGSDIISTGIGGTFQYISAFLKYDDAFYIVEDVDVSQSGIVLYCYRYTKMAWDSAGGGPPRPEEIWSGRTAAEYDAFWESYTAQDATIAPLRNPFGV